MDSKLPMDDDDDNELIFQDLTPKQPANMFQKSIIRIQNNWPPHWNKRHLFIVLPVLSVLLIFFILFEFIHPPTTSHSAQELAASIVTNVTQISDYISYDNVIYVLLTQTLNNYDQLEALNAKTGMLVWIYVPQNVEGIKLFGNILYIQTNTNLVAFNANTRTQLWEKPMFSDASTWQADQGILFIELTNNLVTALNASTGAQLWQTQQPSKFWRVDNGVFYTAPPSGPGLNAFNAHNGQQLWYNANINQNVNSANSDQRLMVSNGNFYLQSSEKQSIQAFSGQTGKQLWQLNTHEHGFSLAAQDGFLVLSNAQDTNVEVINDQTGKQLWQRQGTLIYFAYDSLNQIIISSMQKNETDIIRTTDGTILYHIPRAANLPAEALLSIENGIAFFQYVIQSSGEAVSLKVEAVRLSNGTIIWTSSVSQGGNEILSPQNGTIDIVLTGNTSLLALRADNGHTLWQHTFGTTSN